MTIPLVSLLSGGIVTTDTPPATPATGFRDLIAALVMGLPQGEAGAAPDQADEDRPDDHTTTETTVAAALAGVVPAPPATTGLDLEGVTSEDVTPGQVESIAATEAAAPTTEATGETITGTTRAAVATTGTTEITMETIGGTTGHPVVPPANPDDPGHGPASAPPSQPPASPTAPRGKEIATEVPAPLTDPRKDGDSTPRQKQQATSLDTTSVEKTPSAPDRGHTPPGGSSTPPRDDVTLDPSIGAPAPKPPASTRGTTVLHPVAPPERTLPEPAAAHRPENDHGDGPTVEPSPTLEARPHGTAEAPSSFKPASAAPATGPERPAGLEKVVDAIRELAGSRPPRSIAVRLDHLGGVRVTVSLRSDGIHLSVPGGRPEHHALLGDLTSALGREGFDLAGSTWSGTEQRPRHRPDSDDSEARTAPRPPRRSRRVDPDDAVRM